MAEADEFWSYVGKKKNQRWTWYAVERKSGIQTTGKVTANIFLPQNMSSEKWTHGKSKGGISILESTSNARAEEQSVFQRTKKFMTMLLACILIVIILKTVNIQKTPDQRI